VLFLQAYIFNTEPFEEGTVGTTKLTRKEILAEDPVHLAIVQIVDLFRERGKLIGLVAAGVVVLGVGVYFGMEYLDSRDMAAQQQLGRAMDFFHGRIDPTATDDPFSKGAEPTFRSEAARLQAAAKEFSEIVAKHGSSKVGVMARYYLGLCELRQGRKNEAVQLLEAVRNNTKDRTVAYLAKKVLAKYYLDSGNFKAAQDMLEGMIRDPQCELPKEDLKLDLSRVLVAEGKRDEAIKLLRSTRDESGKSMLQSMLAQELNRLEGSAGAKSLN
jgi:predicted negative regulator of RcsB-dependent stress response